jgi:uncharacterized protein YfaT (DUF1175 family)
MKNYTSFMKLEVYTNENHGLELGYQFNYKDRTIISQHKNPYLDNFEFMYRYDKDSTISSKECQLEKEYYKYNEQKDVIYKAITYMQKKGAFETVEIAKREDKWVYEYDAKGNWIKCYHLFMYNGKWVSDKITERTIVYE